MVEFVPLLMFLAVCLLLMFGYPVAFTLAGTALAFILTGTFDAGFLSALPGRMFGTINNSTLIAVPLFIMMGTILEKSRVAEELLDSMARAFGSLRGGLGISVVVVGMLLAASTGIVGATVVTMGLLSLPSMLRNGYSPSLATGTICATGTLGQIIPPSIALVLLGDILSNAYQRAQLNMNIFNPKTVSVGDLFVGALIPGLVLVAMYIIYLLVFAHLRPQDAPPANREKVSAGEIARGLLPPLVLIAVVLGSILAGAATPTEAAYGLHDTGGCRSVFPGLPRVWWRRADPPVLHRHARGRGGRAHCRSHPSHDGTGSYLVGYNDRPQSTDLLPHTTFWICAFLPAGRGAGKPAHRRYLPGSDPLYNHTVAAACGIVDMARYGNLATGHTEVVDTTPNLTHRH
jgi:hypothetical protein